MATFRLVAADLDGTLLDPAGEVSPRTRSLVGRLRAAGVTLALATSRRLTGAAPVADALGLAGPVIVYDGAQTRDHPSSAIHAEHALALATARQVVEVLAAHALRPIAQYGDASGESLRVAPPLPGDEHGDDYLGRFATQITVAPVPDLCLAAHGPLRVVAFGRLERLQAATQALAALDCGVQVLPIGNYGTSELTVFASAASKGNALVALAQQLGIPIEAVFAIGDGINDVSLLRAAGMGVAMANGNAETRAVAAAIAPPNSADGAARAIEHYVLGLSSADGRTI